MREASFVKSPALPLLALTLAGLLLRVVCLLAHAPTVDDLMVAISAVNFVDSGLLGPTMWNHPVLRNLLAYGMLMLFGPGAAGVIGLNLLMGTLCIPLVHAVTRRLTGERRVALSAALLFALEPLAIEYSSQAINDIYLAFFPLAGILCVYRHLDSRRPGWLLAAGALFGLGIASKWSALFQLAVMVGVLLVRELRGPQAALAERGARALFQASALVVLPLTIYLATFAPWFARGYSLAEWPALQVSMYQETKLHTGYHDEIYGDHIAAQWFVRPGVSHVDRVFTLPEGPSVAEPTMRDNLKHLMAVANPMVWLAVIPALLLLLNRAWRARSEELHTLAALLLASYLPFAVVPRPVWFNTGVVVLPYVVMTVAYGVWRLFPETGSPWRRRVPVIYLGLACLVSLALYPLAIGLGFRLPLVGESLLEGAKHEQGVSKDIYQKENH